MVRIMLQTEIEIGQTSEMPGKTHCPRYTQTKVILLIFFQANVVVTSIVIIAKP